MGVSGVSEGAGRASKGRPVVIGLGWPRVEGPRVDDDDDDDNDNDDDDNDDNGD